MSPGEMVGSRYARRVPERTISPNIVLKLQRTRTMLTWRRNSSNCRGRTALCIRRFMRRNKSCRRCAPVRRFFQITRICSVDSGCSDLIVCPPFSFRGGVQRIRAIEAPVRRGNGRYAQSYATSVAGRLETIDPFRLAIAFVIYQRLKLFSQWYRQNRELKRRSQIITQKLMQGNSEGSLDIELSDEVDNNFEDVDQLRETVKGTEKFVFYNFIDVGGFPMNPVASRIEQRHRQASDGTALRQTSRIRSAGTSDAFDDAVGRRKDSQAEMYVTLVFL